jgi:hypothetical protein
VLTVPALTLRFRSRYPAVRRSVGVIRGEVLEIARDCGAEGACLEDIRLAVSEAAREVVTRGQTEAYVHVQVELGDGELVVTICGAGAEETAPPMSFLCTLAVVREHDSAVKRLKAARAKQNRLSARLKAAVGTSAELTAYARLRAAGDDVASRQAWVHWVDDNAYRGLNAGPFELRADPEPAGTGAS